MRQFFAPGALCAALALLAAVPAAAQVSQNVIFHSQLNEHSQYADIWGYTHTNGDEYALLCTSMGLAVVNTRTCLPLDEENREECDLCYVECEQAGYHAIEMRPIELPVDRELLEAQGFSDFEIDEMGTIRAPFVDADKCTGCGICTYRCHTKYVVQGDRLQEAAITISVENEHRWLSFPSEPGGFGGVDT